MVARHIGKYTGQPGRSGSEYAGRKPVTAANYVWGVAKPDGLTILAPHNNVYLGQLSGQKSAV
jgi:hypothetical protein